MILLVILAVGWLVVLGPSLLRRRSQHGDGVSSISHFHRQLRVLEHSGGQPIVLPAYRLHSVDDPQKDSARRYPDVAAVPVLTVVGADRLPKPALAFLAGDKPDRSDGDRAAPSHGSGGLDVRHRPIAEPRSLDSEARMLARRRRRDTLTVLGLLVVASFLIGFVPGAGLAWVVTVIAGMALAAYVAMLVHLRALAEERDRKLHYLRPTMVDERTWWEHSASTTRHGDVGFGDSCDQDVEYDDRSIGDPHAYEASRLAHPARQLAAR